jgi:hypothetical protein
MPFRIRLVPDAPQTLLEQLIDENLALLRDHKRNGYGLDIGVLVIAVDAYESIALNDD